MAAVRVQARVGDKTYEVERDLTEIEDFRGPIAPSMLELGRALDEVVDDVRAAMGLTRRT